MQRRVGWVRGAGGGGGGGGNSGCWNIGIFGVNVAEDWNMNIKINM